MGQQYLSDTEVAERYGCSRTTIWRWHRDNPNFPRVVKLGPATSRWRLADLEAWDAAPKGFAA